MYGRRTLSLVLALPIAMASTALLHLGKPITATGLLAMGGVILVVAFAFIHWGLKKLLFSQMESIHDDVVRQLTRLSASVPDSMSGRHAHPLRSLSQDIYWLMAQQQKKIDELKKMETFRTDFVADVSHELKTPLFAVQGFIHTLLDGAIDDDRVRVKFLKKAAKSLDGLDALLQDLLTLSQIEMGNAKMQFANIDLYSLCEEVISQLVQRGTRRRILLKKPPNGLLLIVRADWLRIRQVLTNLISNAIKYTEEKDTITVYFKVDRESVTTLVMDTGIGIAEPHLERIFQRFYRVDKSRSKEKGGTGLGLSIVKHILGEHGSKIEVKSRLHEGSTFYFSLPRAGVENINLPAVAHG